MVEILSKGTRRVDERTKRDLYDRVGVREYWVVDPLARAIVVFRRAADATFPEAARLEASNGDTLTTPLLPGFALAMTPFFSA